MNNKDNCIRLSGVAKAPFRVLGGEEKTVRSACIKRTAALEYVDLIRASFHPINRVARDFALALKKSKVKSMSNENATPNRPLVCRGVRGATTIDENTPEAILKGTRELLALIIRFTDMSPDDVASAYFTTTTDLDAAFPAVAARQFNWFDVALMCGHELDVPGSLRKCIRVLIHWNTTKTAKEIRHVYIKGAAKLRPERSELPPVDWDELESWIQSQINLNV